MKPCNKQMDLQLSPIRSRKKLGKHYRGFDEVQAAQIIMDELHAKRGEWVSKRILFDLTWMHPKGVGKVLHELERSEKIEVGQRYWPMDRYRIVLTESL